MSNAHPAFGAPQTHTVKQGETLLSIAKQHQFRSWEQIWNHPDNASLKEHRKDPQVLAPGDKVFIPGKKAATHTLETNQRHTFTLQPLKAWFRTQVIDDSGRPLANKRFRLTVAGQTTEGTTDDQAIFAVPIDPNPSTPGVLKVFLGTSPETELTWNLKLGHLDPVDSVAGLKARLTNLGFACGPINSTLDEATHDALRSFQIVYRLEVTGEPDAATRAKLLFVHDQR